MILHGIENYLNGDRNKLRFLKITIVQNIDYSFINFIIFLNNNIIILIVIR